ncbi:MAG: riboflavin synthase [Immundisolibacter sp.]
MFTGIIQAVGQVAALERHGGDVRLYIGGLPLSDGRLGESIAVSGVCLTAVAFTEDGFVADVSAETLTCTTLGDWRVGERVNLERALVLGGRLGGHLVSGHVDGVGEVVARRGDARSQRFTLRAPAGLARYIAAKGSITLDGVSLTVNAVDGAQFEVNIVPHTLTHTSLDAWQPGWRVNIEVDLLARYLERLLGRDSGGVDLDLRAEHEFVTR